MKLKNIITAVFGVVFITCCVSCKKGWLDVKPEKSLVLPKTIADFQALLDNTDANRGAGIRFNTWQPSLDEVGADDFYVTSSDWNSSQTHTKNAYIWASEIFPDVDPGNRLDWEYPYKRIFYCNIVLEGLENIVPVTVSEQIAWKQAKGHALFLRAYSHYTVAQLFCKPYTKNQAATDLGIPLRLESDINIPSVRSTVQATYDQIIADLRSALELLPVATPIANNPTYIYRPTQAATNAMLARVYLSMEDYENALKYANESLNLYSTLINFNLFRRKGANGQFLNGHTYTRTTNTEILFDNSLIDYSILRTNRCIVDSSLYKMYDSSDLRKTMFFFLINNRPGHSFFGSYIGNGAVYFSGLATDEMYLIRSECNARLGNVGAAMYDLNTLLRNRWDEKMPYTDIAETDPDKALRIILNERRKELCFRGLRWTDLRRLNKDTRFAVTLTRQINGNTYTLEPNSKYYVLPFPPEVIQLSNMQQNPR
ncbi:MAG TPA: RagB/SusD family nutrient uptake outer membrane protein [Chitinophagaceae bacterium]|nr:RagB/SusD family nutrient uptake outer membrane protein [Chitinophagaceae bacterium]